MRNDKTTNASGSEPYERIKRQTNEPNDFYLCTVFFPIFVLFFSYFGIEKIAAYQMNMVNKVTTSLSYKIHVHRVLPSLRSQTSYCMQK